MIDGLWTLDDIATWEHEQTGRPQRSREAIRVALHRLGVQPHPIRFGRGGTRLYNPAAVRAALPTQPGQGARTDLTRGPGAQDDDEVPRT